MIAFYFNRFDLFVFYRQIDAFLDLIPPSLVGGVNDVPGLLIDELLPEAVAGFLVDLPEGDSLV
jgi:hypothetical protein